MDTGKKKQFKYYDSYIVKVLKTIGNCGITMDCRNQLNSCLIQMSKHISGIAFELIVSNGKKTLSKDEVLNALKIVFVDNSPDMLRSLVDECEKAMETFKNSEKNVSRQSKSGIIFAPSVAEKFLRNFDYNKIMISASAPVYLATALEFITMRILFDGLQKLSEHKHKRLTTKDIDKGIQDNEHLHKLIKKINFTFIEGACVEFIHPSLLMKSTHYTKKSKTNPKTKYKPGALSLKSIKQSQKDGMTLVIPKHTFETHIRQFMNIIYKDRNIKISKNVFPVIQHYIELYLVKCLYDVNDISIHCNRVKVLPSDIKLAIKLKKIDVDVYRDILDTITHETSEDDDLDEAVEEKKIIIFE